MSQIAGKTFILLGTFSVYQYEVRALIENHGGTVIDYIGISGVDYAVVGENPNKAKMAYLHKSKTTIVMHEDDLETMIRAAEAVAIKKAKIDAETEKIRAANEDYGVW